MLLLLANIKKARLVRDSKCEIGNNILANKTNSRENAIQTIKASNVLNNCNWFHPL